MSSLLLAYQLRGKKVVVIGAGEVAAGRVKACYDADASIIEVYGKDVHPDILALEEDGDSTIEIFEGAVRPENVDLEGVSLAFTAIDDRKLSAEFVQLFRNKNIMCNAADIPELCDFYFGSTINRGPLQVLVSTNGNAPRLARRVRQELEHTVDQLGMEGAFAKVGKLREELRKMTVTGEEGYDPQTVKKRMKWMSHICDKFTFSQMAALTDKDIGKLLALYPQKVSYSDIRPS